ncbi:MAG: di-heme oxidoredictase family protein [Planctomycetota bacterium]
MTFHCSFPRTLAAVVPCAALLLSPASALQDDGPALGTNRITQADIVGGGLTLSDIRAAGMRMFATPFNRLDGYGDGLVDPIDKVSPGGRPTLQSNGTFLRVNGLDAQTCMECHSVGSNATVPFTFAVGGVGGSNNNAIFQPRLIDVADQAGNGYADFDGRFINPPFLFGSGGIELVAAEMTADLQLSLRAAFSVPDTDYPLVTHGVSFGHVRYDSAAQGFDYSGVEGIDDDLVVRPFGRKGEFATVRGFDIDAMRFHFGMEPVEFAGPGIDQDQDGVSDEILIGELSALHIFNTNLERPEIRDWNTEAQAGFDRFVLIGCANCHTPELNTRSTSIGYRFPEIETAPQLNEFYRADLEQSPAGFEPNSIGGITVPLFSDLKRHDMGPELAENFGSPHDAEFITARLWGAADTAPYLHDGRATTLTDAILMHGGEGLAARDAFAALTQPERVEILTFLKRLRTPEDPAQDILP